MAVQLPLIAYHLQKFRNPIAFADSAYDEARCLNIGADGELSCARASKPYTAALTPGHTIKGGYTPSGYKPSKFVPAKMDKRAGK